MAKGGKFGAEHTLAMSSPTTSPPGYFKILGELIPHATPASSSDNKMNALCCLSFKLFSLS